MANRYARWLIAKGNVFSPGSAAIAKLADRLHAEKWIGELSEGRAFKTVAAPGDGVERLPAELTSAWLDGPGRDEMRLVWTVGTGGALSYPLSIRPAGSASCTLEIHRATEYLVPTSDGIEPLEATCACGEDLTFEWDPEEVTCAFRASTGIFAECEECSRTYDPSQETAMITNPFDESEEEVPGGAAYRFALVVDCGESFAADAKLAFAPELVALVEEEFGRGFYQVGALLPGG